MPCNIVEVHNLRKQFGNAVAVNDLSFVVKEGEFLGLLGVNGAGKSTTIFMLLGLITPCGGEIKIFSSSMKTARVEILKRMNFASAYQFLPYNLKAWENLLVFAEIYRVEKPKEKIEEVLDLFELTHLRNRATGQLSSGEQTRLNLCKALLNEPDLLLLDEPTASLDPDLADKVRKVLRDLHRKTGMTIITTSHNMQDVTELCDRVVFMQRGEIVAEGQVEEIMKRFESSTLEDVFITIARNPILERV